jgi:predicted secreted hydrolase
LVNPARRRLLLTPLVWAANGVARADVRYPDVREGVTLTFPHDEGAHPEFRNEWWYITGWLRVDGNQDLGVQITFFRNRPGVAEENRSRFAPRQLLFAHAAIADPARQRLVVDERAARAGFGLAEAAEDKTDVHIGDWSLRQTGATYHANVRAKEFEYDLAFAAHTPVLLQGIDGVSRKGPDPLDASYYYSRPQLEVTGSLRLAGAPRSVRGVAWLDHEWSSRYLTAAAAGWDWTGINFDDGGALMAFRIRSPQGDPLWAGGAFRDGQGNRRVFAPNEIAFEPLRRWRSPRTNVEYPIAFRIRAGEIEATLVPLFADQELDARGAVGVVYWEGAVRVALSGGVQGRGYLELTGSGERLRF